MLIENETAKHKISIVPIKCLLRLLYGKCLNQNRFDMKLNYNKNEIRGFINIFIGFKGNAANQRSWPSLSFHIPFTVSLTLIPPNNQSLLCLP